MSAVRRRHLRSLAPRSSPTAADSARRDRLTSLHEASYADLLRFVQRRLPGPEAEDVVALVFETAWVRLDQVPEDLADARPWLFGVARNTMANHRRAAVRRTGLAVRLAVSTTPDALVQVDEHDGVGARIDLVRAWRTLGEGDQEVLSLVAFDGLGGAQAAQVLGISRSAFAMRLQRARQRLAAVLRTGGPDDGGAAAEPTSSTSVLAQAPPALPTSPTPRSTSQEMTWPRT